MGSGLSTPAASPADAGAALEARALALLSPFERMSLRKHAREIAGDENKLLEVLGLAHAPGSELILRMARHSGGADYLERLATVVCWFDGRLVKQLKVDKQTLRRQLFDSLAVAEINDQPYVDFLDLQRAYTVVLSAFDWVPAQYTQSEIEMLDAACSLQLLDSIKTPAVLFPTFERAVAQQPYAFVPLAKIWDRLLYDKDTVDPSKPIAHSHTFALSLPRDKRAMLYVTVGPILEQSVSLFEGSRNGYSMRAFEVGVTKWAMPTLLVVKGWQPRKFETAWKNKHHAIDKIIPPLHGAPLQPVPAKVVRFALFVQDPWKLSAKHSFGDCAPRLIQLEPTFRLWELPHRSMFLTRGVGLGAGLRHAPLTNETDAGVVLFVDDSMEHGVLRVVPGVESEPGFEHRFYIDEIEVLGCGTAEDLQTQKRLWERENEDAQRRTSFNLHEDVALLQLEGLIGRYS